MYRHAALHYPGKLLDFVGIRARTTTVEATDATPALAITDLHCVPGVHTHFASTCG